MKISLLCPMLSSNALGRAFVLAKVLERHYTVEIVGPVMSSGIWPPLKQEKLNYVPIIVKPGWKNFKVISTLLSKVTGDIVYASKPLLTSFGVGILRKIRSKTPLVLDIDDWEYGALYRGTPRQRLNLFLKLNTERVDAYYPFIWLMYQFIGYADAITVSSTFLQQKYGGTVVRHGRDINFFNSANFNITELREHYGLLNKKVVMFLGTPRLHKGLIDLIKAVEFLDRSEIVLAIVGVGDEALKKELQMSTSAKYIRLFGMQPFSKIPGFLAMADVVVIAQREDSFATAQVPAKLFDAMAMAKPIVSTAVSDIPDILNDCGIVVESQNIEQIANGIQWVLNNEQAAREMGLRAREKCVKEYSLDAINTVLTPLFSQFE